MVQSTEQVALLYIIRSLLRNNITSQFFCSRNVGCCKKSILKIILYLILKNLELLNSKAFKSGH